jgi:sn-glycerol 3-phosphate transport system substrate-binding protein
MKRIILSLFVLVTSLGAAFAADQVEISLAYPVAVTAPIAQIMNGYAADFMAKNPGVKVNLIFSGAYGDVKTAVQTAIQGKAKAPELAIMLATDVHDLIDAKYIDSVDDLVAADKDGKDFVKDLAPAYLGNSYFQGKLYGIPFQRSAVVLYYNADLLDAAKLKAPATWTELADAAQKLTVDGGKTRWGLEYPSDNPYWLFQPLAIGGGKNVFSDDKTVNFNAPEVVEAVQFYLDLSKKYKAMPEGVQASWGSSTQNFIAGKTAMVVHTTGSLTNILAGAKFKVGVMALPGKKANAWASVTGGGNLYLTAGHSEAERKAAWSFVRFITDPVRVVEFSQKTGYVPYRQSATATAEWKAYVAKTPQAKSVADVLPFMKAEISTHALTAVKTSLNGNLQAAFNAQLPAKEAMDKAQAEATKILADFQ